MQTLYLTRATVDHIEGMVNLEKEVWGEEGASADQLRSRIKKFPEGNPIILLGDEVIACGCFQYCDDLSQKEDITWSSVTGDGNMSHQEDGACIYGINLTAGNKLAKIFPGSLILEYAVAVLYTEAKEKFFLGSRIPGLAKALSKKENSGMSVNDYIQSNKDPELRFYLSQGFEICMVMADYFPDPKSLNYGVLIELSNRHTRNRVLDFRIKDRIKLSDDLEIKVDI